MMYSRILKRGRLQWFSVFLIISAACVPSVQAVIVDDPPSGALIRATLHSKVGVVLDEIPPAQREAIAASYLQMPASFWRERAVMQLDHTSYRLTYRGFYYDAPKGSLPLPPKELWRITLAKSGAHRKRFQGHDVVLIAYQFTTTILTDADSAAQAERRLGRPRGSWHEPFKLPLDPEFVLQRTGLACIDEAGFPPNTADSENARFLFDHECEVETPQTAVCHLTPPLPTESCTEALRTHVGRVDTALHFKRLRWNDELAAQVRTSAPQDPEHPDLEVVAGGLANHRIAYKYIPPDSCTIVEGCVKAPGWRRVLQFDASVQNLGGQPLTLGAPEADSPLLEHNVFEFSACHEHFHFSHYGDFTLGPSSVGDKRAFCLESTQRYANHEFSPLTHPFSCDFQGIAAGWGDDYIAGIPCQWIDITDEDIPEDGAAILPLQFEVNPDQFLCEGTPVTDEAGNLLFEPTDFKTETGAPVDRPLCEFIPNYERNNRKALPVSVPETGSFVTTPCTRAQSGPLRNCGFIEQEAGRACTPGAVVTLSCHTDSSAAAQVLRVCETSAALGVGVACPYEEALATATVTAEATAVQFTCPGMRDEDEPGGQVALYVAALSHQDAAQDVTCQVQ